MVDSVVQMTLLSITLIVFMSFKALESWSMALLCQALSRRTRFSSLDRQNKATNSILCRLKVFNLNGLSMNLQLQVNKFV